MKYRELNPRARRKLWVKAQEDGRKPEGVMRKEGLLVRTARAEFVRSPKRHAEIGLDLRYVSSAERQLYNLIFMDIQMPKMDGYATKGNKLH